ERQAVRDRLGIDASFLTRVLTKLEQRGLVASSPSATDARAINLALTAAGRAAFADLNQRSRDQIQELLTPLTDDQRREVVEAMTVLGRLLHVGSGGAPVAIRPLRPGDMGWVIERHGAVYFDQFHWDADFEALVARVVADYHSNFKPGRESAWIAEVDGA